MEGITRSVKDFYADLPFNYYGDAKRAAKSLKKDQVRTYPDLVRLLLTDAVSTVLDAGCGAGWFSNSIALHYGKRVTGVDMTVRALERAREVAERLEVDGRAEFVESDLFEYRPDVRFDVAASVGVLHHTRDCRGAFAHVGSLAADDGWLFVGLYHLYGRRPFLTMFAELVEREGEDAALAKYAELHPQAGDETHLRSWFRDQVLHPHETQHTLEEVLEWLAEDGFRLESTSINGFEPFGSHAELVEREKTYEEVSIRRNREEGRYFPGFFTVLAKRESS